MMNGISSLGRMPGMEQMQQMRAKAFEKADADASGGLGKAEFADLLKNSPMGKMGAGPDATAAFGRIDGDGNGSLSKAELDSGMEQMLQSMRSTVQAFAGAEASGSGSAQQDTLQTLLAALQGDAVTAPRVSRHANCSSASQTSCRAATPRRRQSRPGTSLC
jgi:EF hand